MPAGPPWLRRRRSSSTRPGPPRRRPGTPAAEVLPAIASSANVLVAAATPLLQLLARLRNTPAPPFSGDLRERAAGALRGFEQRARAAGVAAEQLRPPTGRCAPASTMWC